MLEDLINFFNKSYKNELLKAAREGKDFIIIDYEKLDKENPGLSENLLENPDDFLKQSTRAIQEIDLGVEEVPHINVRIRNVPDTEKIRIRDLRSKHIGKFINVEGTVKRASEVLSEIETAIFLCPDCGEKIRVPQEKNSLTYPQSCECGRKKGFQLIDKELRDVRKIVLQDPFETVEGEKPGEIKIYLKEDLTTPQMQRKTDPGNRLKVSGIFRGQNKTIQGRRTKEIDTFLEANYVETTEVQFEELEISPEEEREIKNLSKREDVYDVLVRSLAPSMYGLEAVKKAIILQLFEGVSHLLPDGTMVRGNIHILLVGDPSSGKTQLLKLTSRIMPRGRYVSGKGASAAGLTASVSRDEEMGGWVLDAGALVLSNKSILSIDEFDKISVEDQVNLHEAMSTQTVSISKASIQATLPAQTSILAGANPKLSRFEPYKSFIDQVQIPETLLSRFDLKFAIRDVPDKESDERIVDHVIKTRLDSEKVNPEIEPGLLRKYIAYARQNIRPELTRKAAATLKNFYINLRSAYSSEETTVPITLRQYEALIRLSEASAKIRLSNEVAVKDTQRAIELMKETLRQFGYDTETGKLDIDMAEGGVPSSKRSKIRIVLDVIEKLEEEIGRNIPMEDLIATLEDEGVGNAEQLIREMKHEGLLFEPKPGYIQRI